MKGIIKAMLENRDHTGTYEDSEYVPLMDLRDIEREIVLYEKEKNELVIQESVAGAMLILIPKLIALILKIVGKIFYLLALPLVVSLIRAKNIHRVGSSVVRGNTSIGEVVSSMKVENVRNAFVSMATGDVAAFVDEIDNSLSEVQIKNSNEFRQAVTKDDFNLYENLSNRNEKIIHDINEVMRSKHKVVKMIDESKLHILNNSLEMMKDENLIHTELSYIKGVNDVVLSDFESKNHRYDLKYLESFLTYMDSLVQSLEKGGDTSLVDIVRQDTSDSRQIFNQYYLECVAKMNSIKEYLPQDLYRDHFRIQNAKIVSNLKVNHDLGDFKHLKDNKLIDVKSILEILKDNKDNLDDLNATTVRIFAFMAGHINNHNNEKEIKERKDNIEHRIKEMQDRVTKTQGTVGYGAEQEYIAAHLEFLRTDLMNIMYTVKHSKLVYLGNHEKMAEIVDIMSEEIVGSYMYMILDDIIKHPNIYKADEAAMKAVIAKFKDMGGQV